MSEIIENALVGIRAALAVGDKATALMRIRRLALKVPFFRLEEIARQYNDPAFKAMLWGAWGPETTLVASSTITVENSFLQTAGMLMSTKGMQDGRNSAAQEIGVQGVHSSAILDDVTCPLCERLDGEEVAIEDIESIRPPHHCFCFISPLVKVYTSKGWENIGDIKLGDLVLTHRGKFKKVTHVFKNPGYKGKVVEITLYGAKKKAKRNRRINITPEHPILINNNGVQEWKPAIEIKEGDKIYYLAGKCAVCKEIIPHDSKVCKNSKCQSKLSHDAQWNGKGSDALRKKYAKKIKQTMKDWPKEKFMINMEKAYSKTREMVKNGTHHFVDERRHDCIRKSHSTNSKGRHKGTFIEKKMAWLLGQIGIDYQRGASIEKPADYKKTSCNYWYPDFLLPKENIVIECDGKHWHGTPEQKKYDQWRQRGIESIGYTVLRFTDDDIKNNLKACGEEIERVLQNHRGEYEFTTVPVRKVKIKEGGKKSFTRYNLEVEDDESYIAGRGFVVHNCRCMLIYVGEEETNWNPSLDEKYFDSFEYNALVNKYGHANQNYEASEEKMFRDMIVTKNVMDNDIKQMLLNIDYYED